MMIQLAKSRTKEVRLKRLAAASDVKRELAAHLDERNDEFVSCAFLERGISRHGKVTSNAIENTNAALKSW